jgi:hypothetical protein
MGGLLQQSAGPFRKLKDSATVVTAGIQMPNTRDCLMQMKN